MTEPHSENVTKPVPANVLVHAEGKEKPRALRLAANTVIGRATGCDLRLEDTYVSQEHARIFAKNGSWYAPFAVDNGNAIQSGELAGSENGSAVAIWTEKVNGKGVVFGRRLTGAPPVDPCFTQRDF